MVLALFSSSACLHALRPRHAGRPTCSTFDITLRPWRCKALIEQFVVEPFLHEDDRSSMISSGVAPAGHHTAGVSITTHLCSHATVHMLPTGCNNICLG